MKKCKAIQLHDATGGRVWAGEDCGCGGLGVEGCGGGGGVG